MTLPEALAYFASLYTTLLGMNAVTSAVMAAVLLWLHYRTVPEQRWSRYFGFAFAVFTLQYFLSWLAEWLGRSASTPDGVSSSLGELILNMGSVLNNVLFFVAAVVLLGIGRGWIWAFYGTSALGLALILILRGGPWDRMPPAVLSFACIGLLGWALYANLCDVQERGLGRFFLAASWLYAMINLADGFLPWLASREWNFHQTIKTTFQEIPAVLKPTSDELSVLIAYDAPLFGLVLVLKIFLFAGALLLIVRSLVLVHPGAYRQLLEEVVNGRKEFLSSEGIVQVIGENCSADAAEVCLRVPGLERKRVAWHRWWKVVPETRDERRRLGILPFEVTALPDPKDSVVGMVLAGGCEVISSDHPMDPQARGRYLRNAIGMHSVVSVPIQYHGSTIGALNLERKGRRPFNDTVLMNVRQLANFLGPVLQEQRHLAALDQFATRLPLFELENIGTEHHLSRRIDVVHNTLSPLAVGIGIDIGFRPLWASRNDKTQSGDQLLDRNIPEFNKFLGDEVRHLAEEMKLASEVRVEMHRLQVRKMRVGVIRLAYPAHDASEFDRSRSPLGENYLHRRTVAALLADAVLNSARIELGAALNRLLLAIHAERVDSPQRWLEELDRGVRRSGLLWAVARISGDRLLGESRAVKLVERIFEEGGGGRMSDEHMKSIHVESPTSNGAHHVVSLPLRPAGAHLWLGVLREGFGFELEQQTPWKDFLERLAEAAGASLLPILARTELTRMAEDQMRLQGLRTALVTMGTMTHQLSNFIRGFSSSVASLEEAVRLGQLHTDEDVRETLENMRHSTRELVALLEPMTQVTIVHGRSPCDLWEVIEHAHALFQIDLEQRGTSFEVRPTVRRGASMIRVPADVATLAIANLISNSLDALRKGGSITVEVEERPAELLCHVIDDGPGLADSTQGKPFALGVTTKANSGGWGLYLTRQSLAENQAMIEITKPGPGGTDFTIRFPRADGELGHEF